MDAIEDNLKIVTDRVSQAKARGQNTAQDDQLLAVSKTWPAEKIQLATDAGQRLFGENRVQELIEKVPVLPQNLRWHLIGHLQKNKIRRVLPLVESIHSIDSLALAQQVSRIAGELERHVEIYLQVNIGEDPNKHGFQANDLLESDLLTNIANLPHLKLEGLMTIPPIGENREDARPHFAALRRLRDQLVTDKEVALPGLSMGMSGDFEVAIEEGATIVRVGSTIFGQRSSPPPQETSQ